MSKPSKLQWHPAQASAEISASFHHGRLKLPPEQGYFDRKYGVKNIGLLEENDTALFLPRLLAPMVPINGRGENGSGVTDSLAVMQKDDTQTREW